MLNRTYPNQHKSSTNDHRRNPNRAIPKGQSSIPHMNLNFQAPNLRITPYREKDKAVPDKSNSSKVVMWVVLHINVRTNTKYEMGNAQTHEARGMVNEGSLTINMAQDTTHDDLMSVLIPRDMSIISTPISHFMTLIRWLREPSRKSERVGIGVEKEATSIVNRVAVAVDMGKEAEVANASRHLYELE